MTKSTTRIKREAAAHPVPQTRDQVITLIARIGQHQRDRDRLEAAMNDELSAVRERWEAQAKPHALAIGELTKGIQLYCEAHRDELTRGGKTKTHTFASGEVKWRMRPPSVVVRGAEAVIEALKKARLGRFVRVKEEVNKDAVLADPEAVAAINGISLRQKEDFVVQPWDTQLEEIA